MTVETNWWNIVALNAFVIKHNNTSSSLFSSEYKKATSEGWRFHARTMMNTEACEAQTLTPIMCRLGHWHIQKDF